MAGPTARARAIPGVLFIEDFDASEASSLQVHPETEAARPAATSVPEPAVDLDEIRRLAYEDGLAAGHRMAEEGIAARRQDLLTVIERSLGASHVTMHDAIESQMSLIAETALRLIFDCVPAFCERTGAEEIRALLRCTLAAHADEPNLVIAVNPAFEDLAKEEAARLSGTAGSMSIIADDGMPLGDARISWHTGAIRRETGRFRRDMLDRLVEIGLMHHSERPSP